MGEASPARATYKVGGVHYGAEYIDTERVIELIGLGIVGADVRQSYAISAKFDASLGNAFVLETALAARAARPPGVG